MKSSKKRKNSPLKFSTEGVKQNKSELKKDLLSQYFVKDEFKAKFTGAYRDNKAFNENGCTIYTTPFKCCFLSNFLSDEDFLKTLEKELSQLSFFEKSNDLYKFHQSDDLKKSSKTSVSSLRSLIYNEFRLWLQDVSGFDDLTDQVDMSCAKYEHTDVLLCHDDELEGRRIAYIFYLVPPWESGDGGTLDLFCTDDHGQPDHVTTSLVPQWNSLVFFEVTPLSFHQVSEVLSTSKVRLSVSGWFHGNNADRPLPYQEPHRPLLGPIALEDEVLVTWINPMYLDAGVVKDVRARFKNESEIELQEFLLEDKYKEVIEGLCSKEVIWKWKGPANKRHYEQVDMESAPAVIKQLTTLLKSEPMFKFLRSMTGLEMADLPLSDDDDDDDDENNGDFAIETSSKSQQDPCCHGEIRRWSHGCYTLVHDTEPLGAEFALDVLLYIGGKAAVRPIFNQLYRLGWKEGYGGCTTYLTSGEDEELLTIHPQENALALVYRDKETVRFVKHVNHSLMTDEEAVYNNNNFLDFSFVYFE